MIALIIILAACAVTTVNLGVIIVQHVRHKRWANDFERRYGWRP